jgi:hypothetical protein
MDITKDTRVSEILEEYGDIADVMEVFGVKRVGRYSVRRMLTKALTVETAARIHRVPCRRRHHARLIRASWSATLSRKQEMVEV